MEVMLSGAKIAFICASRHSGAAMTIAHDEQGSMSVNPADDNNIYKIGKIGGHLTVQLTSSTEDFGTRGINSAIVNLTRTFRDLRAIFHISTGSAIPIAETSPDKAIRLGDVVVGCRRMEFLRASSSAGMARRRIRI
ncbi:hypothetical protein BDV19DRAFT_385354 [Aspergillus venezuelensis]